MLHDESDGQTGLRVIQAIVDFHTSRVARSQRALSSGRARILLA